MQPSAEKRFFLGMLRHEVKGSCSFEELQTVGGSVFTTYRQACNRRGMLVSDECWRKMLEEASVRHSSSKLRILLAIMLNFGNPSDPIQLSEDKLFYYRWRLANMHLDANNEIFNQSLIDLEEKVFSVGGKLLHDYGLPAANREISDQHLEVHLEQNHDGD